MVVSVSKIRACQLEMVKDIVWMKMNRAWTSAILAAAMLQGGCATRAEIVRAYAQRVESIPSRTDLNPDLPLTFRVSIIVPSETIKRIVRNELYTYADFTECSSGKSLYTASTTVGGRITDDFEFLRRLLDEGQGQDVEVMAILEASTGTEIHDVCVQLTGGGYSPYHLSSNKVRLGLR